MAKAGRPQEITKEIVDRIILALKGGNYQETAAAFAGVSKDAYFKWLQRGAKLRDGAKRRDTEIGDPGDLMIRLSDSVEKAMAEAEVGALAVISSVGRGQKAELDKDGNVVQARIMPQWQAMAWLLERTRSARFGFKSENKLKGSPDEPITFTLLFDKAGGDPEKDDSH